MEYLRSAVVCLSTNCDRGTGIVWGKYSHCMCMFRSSKLMKSIALVSAIYGSAAAISWDECDTSKEIYVQFLIQTGSSETLDTKDVHRQFREGAKELFDHIYSWPGGARIGVGEITVQEDFDTCAYGVYEQPSAVESEEAALELAQSIAIRDNVTIGDTQYSAGPILAQYTKSQRDPTRTLMVVVIDYANQYQEINNANVVYLYDRPTVCSSALTYVARGFPFHYSPEMQHLLLLSDKETISKFLFRQNYSDKYYVAEYNPTNLIDLAISSISEYLCFGSTTTTTVTTTASMTTTATTTTQQAAQGYVAVIAGATAGVIAVGAAVAAVSYFRPSMPDITGSWERGVGAPEQAHEGAVDVYDVGQTAYH